MATMEIRRQNLANPELALARDLSILAAQTLKKPSALNFLDTLAAPPEWRSNGVDA